jgi:hypothetical protein
MTIVEPTPENNNTKREKNLQTATFHALRPFVNVFEPGIWRDSFDRSKSGPRFTITKDEWRDYHIVKGGGYVRGFNRKAIFAKILAPRLIKDMIEDGVRRYYTGGTDGLALFMADLDAHEPWQDDMQEMYDDVTGLLGLAHLFPVRSTRGWNLHMKVDYRGHGVEKYRQTLGRLEKALRNATASRKCVVEVKGLPHVGDINGILAKLPCYGGWTWERLHEFEDTPTVTLDWLLARVEQIERSTPTTPPAPAPKKQVKVGSYTGTNVPASALATIPEMVKHYRDHSFYMMVRRPELKRKDVRLLAKDAGIFLALISIVRQYVHHAGETPSAFVKFLWQTAYQDGHVDRQFNDSRYSVLWQTAADCGFLQVEDDHYWYYPDGSRKGQCMKWEIQEQFAYRGEKQAQKEDNQTDITAGRLRVPPYDPELYRPTWVPPPRKGGGFVLTADAEAQIEAVLGAWG